MFDIRKSLLCLSICVLVVIVCLVIDTYFLSTICIYLKLVYASVYIRRSKL